MNLKTRIAKLEEAVARHVELDIPREPDAIDRMFESPEALAAELRRGRCGRLLLLSPEEKRAVLFERTPDDSPLTEAEAEIVAPRAKALAESIFAKLAAAETTQEYTAAVHSHWAVTEAVLRAQEEKWREKNEAEWKEGQSLGHNTDPGAKD